MNGIVWPEILTNENFTYPYDSINKTKQYAHAVADGLCGWANCHLGGEIPKAFGKGMVKISSIVGTATPEGLMAAAAKLVPTQ